MESSNTYYKRHMPHYQPEYATYHVVFRLAGSLPIVVIKQLQEERKQMILDAYGTSDRIIQQIEINRRCFEQFDMLMNKSTNGPKWLKESEIATIIKEAIHTRDNKVYNLIAYCIMPNHVHIIFELPNVGRLVESTNQEKGRDGVSTYKGNVSRLAESTTHNKDRDSVSTYTGNVSQLVRLQSRLRSVETERAKSTVHNKGRVGDSTYRVTKILESLKKYTALRSNRILHRTGSFWQHESYDHVIRDDEELENAIWYVLYNPVKAGLVKEWDQWQWSYCKKELMS